MNGIESVKNNGVDSAVEDHSSEGDPVIIVAGTSKATFEVYTDVADEFRWRLRHENSEIIAVSAEGYTSKQNALGGLDSVKTNAMEALVEDQSIDKPVSTS